MHVNKELSDRYLNRVRDAILPLSVANTLNQAFAEWRFTDRVHDHGQQPVNCQLCMQEHLRYHFEIANPVTHKSLWVGSSCILRFDLSVYEGAERLSPEDAKKKLSRLTREMQMHSCVAALTELAHAEDNQILIRALQDYESKKYLTPRQAAVIFWKLKTHSIEHQASFFKVNLNKKIYQDQLKRLETFRVHNFWEALTPSQKEIAHSYGHKIKKPAEAGFNRRST